VDFSGYKLSQSVIVKPVGTLRTQAHIEGPEVVEECDGSASEPALLRAVTASGSIASMTTWSWRVVQDVGNCTECDEVNAILREVNEETISFPTHLLIPGHQYTVSASATNMWGESRPAFLRIRKVQGLVPRVWLSGTVEAFYAHKPLVLDGNFNLSLCSKRSHLDEAVVYQWSVVAQNSAPAAVADVMTLPGPRLLLQAHSLRAGLTYNITLRVWSLSQPQHVGIAGTTVHVLAPPLSVRVRGGSR
jgi:hypothetical protein